MNATAALSSWKARVGGVWPGLLLAGVVAIASTFISDHRGGPTLLYALLIGMALNGVSGEGAAKAGIDFAARRVLRFGVALLGARITVEQVVALGALNLAFIVAAVVVTIGVGVVFARWLGLSRRIGVLTGGATAICGASAAIAIAAVLPRDGDSDRELMFTIAGITAMSTVAMVLYPVIVGVAGLTPQQAGVFLGGTIHDIAQVVGAGYSISPEIGDAAVLTKMVRIALLLPVVVSVSLIVRRGIERKAARSDAPLLPLFLVGFVALVVAGSLGLVPKMATHALNDVSRACLVLAIAAVGLKTSLGEMRKVGARAIALLAAETVVLTALVLGVQKIA